MTTLVTKKNCNETVFITNTFDIYPFAFHNLFNIWTTFLTISQAATEIKNWAY